MSPPSRSLRITFPTGSEPATVSFTAHWHGVSSQGSVTDATNGFALEFVQTDVVQWTASVPSTGFSFASNVANSGTSVSPFNSVGHKQNGAFFVG